MAFINSERNTAWEVLSDLTRFMNDYDVEHARTLLEVAAYVKQLEEGREVSTASSAMSQLAEIKQMLTDAMSTVNLFGEREVKFQQEKMESTRKLREAQSDRLSAQTELSIAISREALLQTSLDEMEVKVKGLHLSIDEKSQEISALNTRVEEEQTARENLREMLRELRSKTTFVEARGENYRIEGEKWKRRAMGIRTKYRELKDGITKKVKDTKAHKPVANKDTSKVPTEMVV